MNALKANIMLVILMLPKGPQDMEKMKALREAINEKRESKGYQVNLNITYL